MNDVFDRNKTGTTPPLSKQLSIFFQTTNQIINIKRVNVSSDYLLGRDNCENVQWGRVTEWAPFQTISWACWLTLACQHYLFPAHSRSVFNTVSCWVASITRMTRFGINDKKKKTYSDENGNELQSEDSSWSKYSPVTGSECTSFPGTCLCDSEGPTHSLWKHYSSCFSWIEKQARQPCRVILFILKPFQRHPGTVAINYWTIPCWRALNATGPRGLFLITWYTLSYTGQAGEASNNIYYSD